MSQSFRRGLVWTVIAVLLLLGTLLTLRAAPGISGDDPGKAKAQDAIAQAFDCTISLLTFHLPKAETACGKTIALFPKSPLGYKFRGFTYLLEHRFERAEADFREAVKRDPRDADSEAGLGQSLSGQGRFDEALQPFAAALAIRPHDVRYLSARCWARAGQGKDFKSALADCDLAIRLQPTSAVAFDARGLIYLKRKDDARAIRDFSKSLSLDEGRPTALFGRGIAEWHQGDMTSAHIDLALARQTDPDIDDTYVLLGVLEKDCRDEGPSCSLPQTLRLRPDQALPGPYLSVSYRPHAVMTLSGPEAVTLLLRQSLSIVLGV